MLKEDQGEILKDLDKRADMDTRIRDFKAAMEERFPGSTSFKTEDL